MKKLGMALFAFIVVSFVYAGGEVATANPGGLEFAQIGSGKSPTWAREEPGKEGTAKATNGETIAFPEPVVSYLWSAGDSEYFPAVSWNFANVKPLNRWCFDIGRGTDRNLYFVDVTFNLFSLADYVTFPLAEYINPRIGVWGGYNFEQDLNGEDKGLDWGADMVLAQWSFGK